MLLSWHSSWWDRVISFYLQGGKLKDSETSIKICQTKTSFLEYAIIDANMNREDVCKEMCSFREELFTALKPTFFLKELPHLYLTSIMRGGQKVGMEKKFFVLMLLVVDLSCKWPQKTAPALVKSSLYIIYLSSVIWYKERSPASRWNHVYLTYGWPLPRAAGHIGIWYWYLILVFDCGLLWDSHGISLVLR